MVVSSKSNKALKWRLPTWLDRTRLCDSKFRSVDPSWKDSLFIFDTLNTVNVNRSVIYRVLPLILVVFEGFSFDGRQCTCFRSVSPFR